MEMELDLIQNVEGGIKKKGFMNYRTDINKVDVF